MSFRIKNNFRVADKANFIPEFSIRSFSELSLKERIRSKDPKTRYLRKFILHPIKDDEDIYCPSVEVYEKADTNIGIVEYEMVVTVHSLPKLILGNNFQEIEYSNRDKIISATAERLGTIGIGLSEEYISQAPVSVVHFCKNIILPNGAKTVKSEFNKIWANKDNRLIDKLDIASELVSDIPVSQGISYITQQLEKFEIISLASLGKEV